MSSRKKQVNVRLGERWDGLITNAAKIMGTTKTNVEREFHEAYFVKFLQDRRLRVIQGEIFSD